MDLALIFKTLGDDVKLRILGLLINQELCVCDIESVLKISQVSASRHLKSMKTSGILSSRKKAQWVYYELNKTFLEKYPDLIRFIRIELERSSNSKKDLKALASLIKIKGVQC